MWLEITLGLIGLVVGWFLVELIITVPERKMPHLKVTLRNSSMPFLNQILIQLLTAALFVSLGFRFGVHSVATSTASSILVLIAWCVFFAGLVCITFIDLSHRIVPIRILYPTLLISIILLGLAVTLGAGIHPIERAAISGLVAFGAFFTIHFISPSGMGFGDVRLAGLIGLFLGWISFPVAFIGFILTFFSGALIGVAFMIFRGYSRKSALPFAPFMALGAFLAVMWGKELANIYLHAGIK
ncbi:MAG: A24 family peptidase [Actinobacteria bacterium]|nr:A24 family peptidase [Actinomycetota bacterium]MCL6104172.1 A24 family peptidase [Actinomycetota bacterium]